MLTTKRKNLFRKSKKKDYEILLNKEPFSSKNIKPNMILINEDAQSISIIVASDKNSKEYKNLKVIYNSNSLDEKGEIIDYHNISSIENI